MEILIVETSNTGNKSDIDKILSKHVICRSMADKKKYLPLFKQPTCTKNQELLSYAKKYENLLK